MLGSLQTLNIFGVRGTLLGRDRYASQLVAFLLRPNG